jgi:predicted enzyme related to lactoylglutathione lyase
MQVSSLLLNINTEDREKLAAFYRDVVGLPPNPMIGPSAFTLGNASLIIDGHSEVHGPTKEPQRVLINFWVDDLEAEQKRLKAAGVKFIRESGKEEWGGTLSTFVDPDGNYCQLLQYKP